MNKKISLVAVWICCLLALSLTVGCKAKTITVPVTIVQPVVTTITVTSSPATSKTTPVTTPMLKTLSISLTIMAPNDYAAYVLPLYLTGDTELHMSWKVEGGAFRMTVTTPGGKVIPVTAKGVETTGTAEPLGYSGGLVFCTSDAAYAGFKWGGNGYFNFTPHLNKGDAPVKITLNYYFETKPPTTAPPATSP